MRDFACLMCAAIVFIFKCLSGVFAQIAGFIRSTIGALSPEERLITQVSSLFPSAADCLSTKATVGLDPRSRPTAAVLKMSYETVAPMDDERMTEVLGRLVLYGVLIELDDPAGGARYYSVIWPLLKDIATSMLLKNQRKAILEKIGREEDVTRRLSISSGPVAPEKYESFKDRCKRIFLELDVDKSNTLDVEEISLAMTVMGVNINTKHLQTVFAVYDTDADGHIDAEEFEKMYTAARAKEGEFASLGADFDLVVLSPTPLEESEAPQTVGVVAKHRPSLTRRSFLFGGAPPIDPKPILSKLERQRCRMVFDQLDLDKSRTLDESEIYAAMQDLNSNIDRALVKKLFDEADDNSNGVLSRDEFESLYGKVISKDFEGIIGEDTSISLSSPTEVAPPKSNYLSSLIGLCITSKVPEAPAEEDTDTESDEESILPSLQDACRPNVTIANLETVAFRSNLRGSRERASLIREGITDIEVALKRKVNVCLQLKMVLKH